MKLKHKLSVAAAAVIVSLSAQAQTFELNKGWNLAGANENGITASSFDKATSVWQYDGENGWKASSPDGSLTAAMKDFTAVDTLNAGDGFWVNNLSQQTVTINGTAVQDATLNIVSGWQLASLKSAATTNVASIFNKDEITTVWKFANGDWQAYSPKANVQQLIQDAGITALTTLNAGEGFWVNASGNATVLDAPPAVGGLALTMLEKQNAVPFSNAKVYTMDGTSLGTTDYKGAFEVTGLQDGTKVVLAKKGFTVAYGTVKNGSVVVMSQQDPNIKVPFDSGDYTSAKPVKKALSSKDGAASLVVNKMKLNQDVTVSVVPFKTTMSVPTLNSITVDGEVVDSKLLSIIGGGYLNVQNSNGEPLLPFQMNGFEFTASVEQNKILGEIGEILNGNTEVPSTKYATFSASAFSDLQNAIDNGIIKLYTIQLEDGEWVYKGKANIVAQIQETKNPNDANNPIEYTKYKITSDVEVTSLAPYAFAIKIESFTGDASLVVKEGGEKMFDGSIVKGPDGNSEFDWLGDGVDGAVILGGDSVTSGPGLTNEQGQNEFSYKVPLLNPYIDLSLKKEGYYDTSVTCTVDVNGTICPEVQMYKIPTTASITGHVYNKLAEENKIADALVTLVNPEVLSADKIKFDTTEEGLPTTEVGYMPNVTYTWTAKKDENTTVEIKSGKGNELFAKLSAEELYTKLVDTFDNNDSTDDVTSNPTGLWELLVKAEHEFDNTTDTLVEQAIGSFNIDLLITKLASQMTGSLSENLTVDVYDENGDKANITLPGNATDLAIYGGKSIGFLYAKTSSYDSAYWQTEVLGASDNPNYVDETWYGAVKNLGDMQYVIKTPLKSTKGWYSYTSLVKYLGNNFDSLLAEDPTWAGVRWYKSGFTMATSFNKENELDGKVYSQTAFSYMDLPDDVNRELRSIVEIPSINLVGESATAYLRQTTTANDGSYSINMIPANLSGALEVFAKAEGYQFNDTADIKLVNDLEVGVAKTYDLGLVPIGQDINSTNPTQILPAEPVGIAFGDAWTTNQDNCYYQNNLASWNILTQNDLNTMNNAFLNGLYQDNYGLLADDDNTTAGYLWFGTKEHATFSGDTGNYGGPVCGSIVSPTQDLSDFAFPLLTFKTWFEVESVDVAKGLYDQMKVGFKVGTDATVITKEGQKLSLTAGEVYNISILNPDYEPSIQSSNKAYSSAGVDAEPVWIDISVPTEMLAGLKDVQFVFDFNSKDSAYNGFRGWGIDSVTVEESMEDNLLLPPSVPELETTIAPSKLVR